MRVPMSLVSLLALALPAAAAADTPPQVSSRTIVAQGADARSADEAFLATADLDRIGSDRAYAERVLQALAATAAGMTPEARLDMSFVKVAALLATERVAEARGTVDATIAARPRWIGGHYLDYIVALHEGGAAGGVGALERAADSLTGAEERDRLTRILSEEMVGNLYVNLNAPEQKAVQIRLAEVLLRLGWPGANRPSRADYLRQLLVDRDLAAGAHEPARRQAEAVTGIASNLRFAALNRYSPLHGTAGPLQRLERAIAGEDRETAAAVAAQADLPAVLDRMQYLRGVGREADALALATPFLRDVPGTVAADPRGMWVVNEAAYALQALRRDEEALDLMRQLSALDPAGNPDLIGPMINRGELLFSAGRFDEALRHVEELTPRTDVHASDYGRMWVWSTAVCAEMGRGNQAAARTWLGRMEAKSAENSSAMMKAYLCMRDDDAAERLLVSRLQSDDPESAVLALQDYRAGGAETGLARPLYERLRALSNRPRVRAALDRVGRIHRLPLARTYYGTF